MMSSFKTYCGSTSVLFQNSNMPQCNLWFDGAVPARIRAGHDCTEGDIAFSSGKRACMPISAGEWMLAFSSSETEIFTRQKSIKRNLIGEASQWHCLDLQIQGTAMLNSTIGILHTGQDRYSTWGVVIRSQRH